MGRTGSLGDGFTLDRWTAEIIRPVTPFHVSPANSPERRIIAALHSCPIICTQLLSRSLQQIFASSKASSVKNTYTSPHCSAPHVSIHPLVRQWRLDQLALTEASHLCKVLMRLPSRALPCCDFFHHVVDLFERQTLLRGTSAISLSAEGQKLIVKLTVSGMKK